ncbi:hypothetical protein AGMMS49990_05010 [Endomicrobiia bacterium]|nr:hypothetical protein AGMMS49990_05010 [Endomicrobiia bacterium]
MKKFSFLALLVLSVFATNAFAEGEVDVWGGYTRLDSDKEIDKFVDNINDYLKKGSDGVSGFRGLDPELRDVYKINNNGSTNNAFTVGVDYFFGNGENVKPGFRVAYLRSGEKKISMSENGTVIDDIYLFTRVSLASIMPGIRLSYDISEEFSLNGKLFAGIAVADYNFKLGSKYESLDKSEISLGRTAFAMDMSVGAQYLFTKKFGLGLDLGYRPFPSGFSGFTAKLGLNFKI